MTYSTTFFDSYVRQAMPVRVPPFYAVPGRTRTDGWTPLRQAEFIGNLAETSSVAEAARRVGMARETAYRLRRRKWSASFAAAWDAALGRAPQEDRAVANAEAVAKGHASPRRKVTLEELEWRVESGRWRVLLRHGCYAGVRKKHCNSDMLQLASRTARAAIAAGPDTGRSDRSQF